MPEDFCDAASAMWDLAWRLADDLGASERRAHAAEIKRLKADADEAMSNCALVEEERDEAEKRAHAMEEQLAETEAALLDAKFEIARLNGQLAEREKNSDGRLAELRMSYDARTGTNVKNPTNADNVADDTAVVRDDGTQLEMFALGGPGKKKPDDPETMAAD